VVLKKQQGNPLGCRGQGADLLDNIRAVPVLLNHTLDAPSLAFDPSHAFQERFFVLVVVIVAVLGSRVNMWLHFHD
jgi:hypothetical protein